MENNLIIEQDLRENNLNIVEGWNSKELERIFELSSEEEIIGHAAQDYTEPEGPNFFLIGGP